MSANESVNGFLPHNGIPDKSMTPEEMRQLSRNWTLASDAGLLAYLQQYSQDIVAKTHELEKNVDSLNHEAQTACVHVNNIINDFNMLSNTQFVENRVYDEEIAQEPQKPKSEEESPKTKEQQENELVSRVKEAFQLGLDVINSSLQLLEVNQESDSEDEGSLQADQVFQPKDPYTHRPLPHLIGSDAFHKDDYVGLYDLLSEDEYEEKTKDDSESENEDEVEPAEIAAPDISSLSSTDSRDIFANNTEEKPKDESQQSIKSTSSEEPLMNNKVGIHEQISAAIKKRGFEKKGLNSDEEDYQQKPSIPNSHSDDDDLFGTPEQKQQKTLERDLFNNISEAEKSIPVSNPIAETKPKSRLLFSSSEEDENDSLWEDSPASKRSSSKEKTSGDLFNSVVENTSKSEKSDSSKENSPFNVPSTAGKEKKSKGQLLFDEDDEDDEESDNLFSVAKPASRVPSKQLNVTSSVKKQKIAVTPSSKDKSKASSLFSDDDNPPSDELDFSKAEKADSVKKQSSRSSSFFDDNEKDEDDDDIFNPKSPVKKLTTQKKTMSLFDERGDEDDDILNFSSKSAPKPNITSVNKVVKQKKPISLFDNDDEKDEDDLSISETTKKLSSAQSTPSSEILKQKKTMSLFDDNEDDDDDVLSFTGSLKDKSVESKPVESSSVAKQKKATSLFDDSEKDQEEEGSLSFAEPAKSSLKNVPSPQMAVDKKGSSLFDDDKDDIFASVPIKQDVNKVQKDQPSQGKSGTRLLFEQDDLLFGGPPEESPGIDLFKPEKKPSPPVMKSPEKLPEGKKKPIGGVALFGGADLFGQQLKAKLGEQMPVETEPEPELDKREYSPVAVEAKSSPRKEIQKQSSVSFEEPVDTSNTLVSAVKDRAKIRTKRRPPSRKGRQAKLVEENVPQEEASTTSTEDTSSTSKAALEISKSEEIITASTSRTDSHLTVPKQSRLVKSPSTEEEDLNLMIENTLNPVPGPDVDASGDSPLVRRAKERKPKLNLFDDDLFANEDQSHFTDTFTDNIFSGDSSFSQKSVISKNIKVDIFSETNNVEEASSNDIFKDVQSVSKKETVEITENIFASESIEQTKYAKKINRSHLFEDDNDIFSIPTQSSSLNNDTEPKSTSDIFQDHSDFRRSIKTKKVSLFSDDSDAIDDIFSEKSKTVESPLRRKKETTSSKKKILKAEASDLFDDPLQEK